MATETTEKTEAKAPCAHEVTWKGVCLECGEKDSTPPAPVEPWDPEDNLPF
jgi:hypothetical protein